MYILILIFNILLSLGGWYIHKWMHDPKSKWFYKAHMNHHLIQYPPNNYLSTKYRYAGKNSTTLLFAIILVPITIIVCTIAYFINLYMILWLIGSILLQSLFYDYFHDQFHLKNSVWLNFKWFRLARYTHYCHHAKMDYNYGIVLHTWDHVFNTYI